MSNSLYAAAVPVLGVHLRSSGSGQTGTGGCGGGGDGGGGGPGVGGEGGPGAGGVSGVQVTIGGHPTFWAVNVPNLRPPVVMLPAMAVPPAVSSAANV